MPCYTYYNLASIILYENQAKLIRNNQAIIKSKLHQFIVLESRFSCRYNLKPIKPYVNEALVVLLNKPEGEPALSKTLGYLLFSFDITTIFTTNIAEKRMKKVSTKPPCTYNASLRG